MRQLLTTLVTILFAAAPASAQDGPVIFADRIFEKIMNAHADRWAERGEARPVLVFARSDELRKRIADGAKVDLFVSIDEEPMKSLEEQGLIDPATRKPYRRNSIVLFGGNGSQSRYAVQLANPAAVQRQIEYGGLRGKIAMSNPDKNPAGRYVRKVLDYLGIWNLIADRVIYTETDLEAVQMVEDKRADWGITFGSSFRFFEESTPNNRVNQYSTAVTNGTVTIRHLVARLKKSQHPQAAAFQAFLARDPSYSGFFGGE